MTFHEKLAKLMEDRTQAKVARRAGISPVSLNLYLHRGIVPKAETAWRLARALGVSLDWMLDDRKHWPPVRMERAEEVTTAA